MKKSRLVLLSAVFIVLVGLGFVFSPARVKAFPLTWGARAEFKDFVDVDGRGIRLYIYSYSVDSNGALDTVKLVPVKTYTVSSDAGDIYFLTPDDIGNYGSYYLSPELRDWIVENYFGKYAPNVVIPESERAYVYFTSPGWKFYLEYYGDLSGYFEYITSDVFTRCYDAGHEAGYDEGYDVGHDEGYDAGHEEGYDEGHDVGHEEGYTEGYDVGHADGYDVGLDVGYDNGYSVGYNDGHAVGHNDGYNSGHEAGYDEGYDVGHDEGYSEGYDAGHEEGFGEGRDFGYDWGYAEATEEIDGLGKVVPSIVGSIWLVISDFLSIRVLGIALWEFIGGFVAIGLAVLVVRMFL